MAVSKTLTIKSKDTYPPLETTLEQAGGAPIDLTNVEKVKFIMKKDGAGNSNPEIGGYCTIDADKTSGKVYYAWTAGQTDVVGTYAVEWELKYIAAAPYLGGIQSVPNEGYDELIIQSDI